MTITLESDAYKLALSPEMGGCVTALRHDGEDILRPARPTNAASWDARDLSAFPLVPFVGRLVNGEIDGPHGREILPANMPPEPHAIHGHGWQRVWNIVHHDAANAELDYTFDQPSWPWAYHASQVFALSSAGLTLTLRLTNRSDTDMPAGLGWHPYFPRAGAHLKAETDQVWLPLGDRHAVLRRPPEAALDLSDGRALSSLDLDHAYDVAAPVQHITLPTRRLTLASDPLFSKLVIYVPPGEDFFCVEPVSHTPNAVNLALAAEDTGARYLAPGETLSGQIRLSADRRD